MATVIATKSGKAWADIFPEVYGNLELTRDLNNALMLLAAWKTRGSVSRDANVLHKILQAMIVSEHGYKVADEGDMTALGRITYYMVKALEEKPSSWRE